jgi:ribonuclease HI
VTEAWLYVDGGCRSNDSAYPGAMAAGVVLCTDSADAPAAKRSIYLGPNGTNNQAEYLAVIHGLLLAREKGLTRVVVHSDSQLVVRQLIGEYQCNVGELETLRNTVLWFVRLFESVQFKWVPRANNAVADSLATAALP